MRLVAPAGGQRIRIREVRFCDFSAVQKLKECGGLSVDSFSNWERLWHHNPALVRSQTSYPMGWVLEAETGIVGYIGNVILRYRLGNRTLMAATSHGLVTDSEYRFAALSLVSVYFRQKNVDLFLTTTAIESVGKISQAFKSKALPQPEYESVLFWVIGPYAFARALMFKLGLSSAAARVGAVCACIGILTDKLIRRRWPKTSSLKLAIEQVRVDELGEDFQSFWLATQKERPQLLADRSSEMLSWHFSIPDDKGEAQVILCRRGRELVGYAVVRNEPPNRSNGLRRSLLADLLAKGDDPEVLRALWSAAYQAAKQAGSHVFEVLGFPPHVRQICTNWKPYLRRYPSCPFFYKAADPTLHETLSEGDAWYATPFDGDTTLWSFGGSA